MKSVSKTKKKLIIENQNIRLRSIFQGIAAAEYDNDLNEMVLESQNAENQSVEEIVNLVSNIAG